jgi:hypothetical protein
MSGAIERMFNDSEVLDMLETFYDISEQVMARSDAIEQESLGKQESGVFAVKQMAIDLTKEFCTKYHQVIWGVDMYYTETMEGFVNEKLKQYPFNQS